MTTVEIISPHKNWCSSYADNQGSLYHLKFSEAV
ncbi:uncharacterized protein METZ01_LOCUS119601 [marine metagenome]|uniref:Uncharacterized protein n=1 Tax=marine metagenome TaxID=408172 RepID=A0A381XRC0_9ZZZZ